MAYYNPSLTNGLAPPIHNLQQNGLAPPIHNLQQNGLAPPIHNLQNVAQLQNLQTTVEHNNIISEVDGLSGSTLNFGKAIILLI
mmetsp:Transcript_39509/g.60309  ORF Transcript_39509/g.60309 Transcript_39509/m.60309 type:complete len:84 (-) Transcript_39509:29-280(-)|eukprot:CAMPEP_0170479136 /NCGR_PEP_ID=MMETSP0208-20121228/473_1 /TAXON_ID=197538 /ORGANISM="Strombidium inclinatum, Strain S3" /LENGTH=83 /DNA_ID=CAMNT_0010751481 /DNA_START=13 /DNA_END=264 /DNA_ORIENTATION=+